MRDLVRLTGVSPKTLLWSTTLSRWWTIGWSLLLLLPLAMFAITLGGVQIGQLQSGLMGLALLVTLTGAFGMLASVLTADAKNPEKTATTATFFLLFIYNVGFGLLALAIYWGNWLIVGDVSSSLDRLCRRIALWSPTVGLLNALRSPGLFTPTDPGYWLHFLTAVGCAALATLAIEIRFQSSTSAEVAATPDGLPSLQPTKTTDRPSDADSSQPVLQLAKRSTNERDLTSVVPLIAITGRRPRCSDRPFFWKDVYVLSDERRWMNTWSLFYILTALIVMLISVISTDNSDRFRVLMAAIISVVVAAIIVSLRFDALLTAEFRDRTWGSLMLLPVDPCELLRIKLWAALWEQRFVALPVTLACGALLWLGPIEAVVGVGMEFVIALIACGLLCQMSCINQLLGKVWWIGPCQAIGFIAVLTASIAIWANCGLWPGFVLTTAFLSGIMIALQRYCVNWLARNWVEP